MALSLLSLGSNAPNSAPSVFAAATGVLPLGGTCYITYTSVCALTLAAPVADGASLIVISLTAHAHTITTPANVINGVDDTATFGATVGNGLLLRAFGGQWIMALMDQSGITLTEV